MGNLFSNVQLMFGHWRDYSRKKTSPRALRCSSLRHCLVSEHYLLKQISHHYAPKTSFCRLKWENQSFTGIPIDSDHLGSYFNKYWNLICREMVLSISYYLSTPIIESVNYNKIFKSKQNVWRMNVSFVYFLNSKCSK